MTTKQIKLKLTELGYILTQGKEETCRLSLNSKSISFKKIWIAIKNNQRIYAKTLNQLLSKVEKIHEINK